MEAISMSVRVDAGVIGHNNRTFVAKNVNAEKISDNIIYVQKDLKETYKEIFSEALEKYNAKQKRSDRVIKDYYEHIKNGKQEKLFYEAIIQFGNIDNAKVGTEGGERAKKMLDEYMKDFEKRNPNFKVFNAVMHLDESTPHLHIDFIPVAYNQSRGLETRVSMLKACEQMGYNAKSKKESERQQWAVNEKEIMKSIAKKHGLEIENKNITRPHLSVEDYKQTCRELDKKKKQINELYEKSNLNPSEMKKSDLDLLVNHSKQLQKEVEAKNNRISDLENRIQSDFRYIKIGEEQKINFIADSLRKEGVSVIDDLDGIHIPEWAVNKAREIAKKYKPVKLTWRKELALTIDRLVYVAKDLDDLLNLLKEKGYIVRKGKYISIKPSDDPEARAVRTKTLGDEYTEENLIKRIADKQSYVKKTEEKIKTTTGIEREFYIGVQRTVTVIFSGNKIPKKYNPAKGYSINNDWHINELAAQINFINREHINSAAELENLIEKSGANILQQQNSLNEITEMQSSMRDVISKAEFYFANKDKRGDAMFTAKLAAAKERLDKFNVSSIEDLAPLKNQYGENLKALSKVNASMSELQKRQSALLKLQETHQALTNGNYIDNFIEQQKAKKEQDLK